LLYLSLYLSMLIIHNQLFLTLYHMVLILKDRRVKEDAVYVIKLMLLVIYTGDLNLTA